MGGGGGGAWGRGILPFGIVQLASEQINTDTAALLLILLLVQIVVSTPPLYMLHRPMNGIICRQLVINLPPCRESLLHCRFFSLMGVIPSFT